MVTIDTFLSVIVVVSIIMVIYLFIMFRSTSKTSIQRIENFPPGTIVMWDSNLAPKGWALCDGSNGTPDLTGRFVVGVGASPDITYKLHDTGGENFHSLTAVENGKHSHTYVSQGSEMSHYVPAFNFFKIQQVTADSGQGKPHENRPPFMALTYIMKLGNETENKDKGEGEDKDKGEDDGKGDLIVHANQEAYSYEMGTKITSRIRMLFECKDKCPTKPLQAKITTQLPTSIMIYLSKDGSLPGPEKITTVFPPKDGPVYVNLTSLLPTPGVYLYFDNGTSQITYTVTIY